MYPRATVDLAKTLSDLGLLDRENAAIYGVSVSAIRHWRRGRRRNGSRRHGHDTPRCPRCDALPLDERACAYLLGLYLGDGHLILGRARPFSLRRLPRDQPGPAAAQGRRPVVRVSALFLRQPLSRHSPALRRGTGPAGGGVAVLQADDDLCRPARRCGEAGRVRRPQVLSRAWITPAEARTPGLVSGRAVGGIGTGRDVSPIR